MTYRADVEGYPSSTFEAGSDRAAKSKATARYLKRKSVALFVESGDPGGEWIPIARKYNGTWLRV